MSVAGEAVAAGENAVRRNSEALGEIIWLFAHSPMHRRMRLADLERYVLPPVKHGTYRLYKRDGMPVGYVALAWLSKEVEDLWLAGGYTLQADDWVSGRRPWIMQFVVPFGDVRTVRRKLRLDPELRRTPVWTLRPNKGGAGLKIVQFGMFRYRERNPLKRLINTHLPRASRNSTSPDDAAIRRRTREPV
jgi:hemolysin-activating ACP:hemolysin acyltransferase